MWRDGILRIQTSDTKEEIDIFIKVDEEQKIITILNTDKVNFITIIYREFDCFLHNLVSNKNTREEFKDYITIIDRDQELKIMDDIIDKVTTDTINAFVESFELQLKSNSLTEDQFIGITFSILSSFTIDIVTKMTKHSKHKYQNDIDVEKMMDEVFKSMMVFLIQDHDDKKTVH